MSCGVGCRRGSDFVLPWLWHRATVVAPIQPLAWEPPYTVRVALKKKKKKEKKKRFTDINTTLRLPKGKGVGRDKLGVWN